MLLFFLTQNHLITETISSKSSVCTEPPLSWLSWQSFDKVEQYRYQYLYAYFDFYFVYDMFIRNNSVSTSESHVYKK